MDRGHPPDRIDDYRWRDVQDFLVVHDILETRSSLGGLPEN